MARGVSREPDFWAESGGGGNRTRVRNRTGQSVYKLRYPFNFARRPVGTDQPFGLVLLWISRFQASDSP